MGNGWVQRTRRSTVERVIERVHTDVDEMVPMRGGAGGGHLHGGGGGGLVPHGGPGSNGWLNGELARQVHSKFEDMVRQSPAPTRAERSAYDELVRSFPPPESRGRLALGDGSGIERDPQPGIVSPTGGYAAPWMNGGGGGGGAGGDGRYPSRLGHDTAGDAAGGGGGDANGSPAERSIFSDLKSPPPSMRRASGGGGSGSGFTLDDLILRKKGPDAAAARGAIFSPPPSPPGGRGRGRGRRGRKPGAGAGAKKPSPPPEPSESSSESEDADEDADDDYVSPAGVDASSPLEKLARAAEKRGATRAGASPRVTVGKSPAKSPASTAARAARRSYRIGDSDSDDDGNKIAAVRAGRAKGKSNGTRGSREARQLLIAAQRMERVTGGGGAGASGVVATATTPVSGASPSALRGAGTPASAGGRSGGRSTRERRAPSAFWLNEDAKRKDPFATTATPASASAAAESKKTAARAKPGPKAKKPAAKRGRPKSKAKPAAKRRRDDDDDDDDDDDAGASSSSESESESEESEEEETLEARAARTSAVKKSVAKKSAVKSPAKRPRGRSPTKGPTRARPAKKPSKSLAVYSESEDATDEDEDEEDEEDEDEEDEDDDVPPPKGDDDTEESDGDDTEESDEDSEDDTPLASRYKGKPSKAAASPKGKKPPPAAKPKPKPSPKPAKPSPGKGNRRHSAEHAAALVSAEIMGRKTSMARRFGLNVARVVDSEAESSDDDEEEGEDDDDAGPPGSTPTDRSSDRTEASSPATATTDADGGAADTTDADDTPATKGSAGGQPPRSIEKGKRGGWRPGAGRPRKVYDPNDPTPRKRRRLPGEPPRKRGRPRKHPTAEDIEAGHIRRKPASAEEKAAALRRLAGGIGGIFGQDVAAPKPRGRPRKDGSSKSAPPKSSGADNKPARETPAPAVRANAISTERWAARVKKAFAGGNAEASHPDSPPRRREVSFPENEGEGAAGAEPRDGAASAPRSAPAPPPPSGRYGSDRENEQVSAAKSSRRKSILRTLGKSLGEENERDARRNALDRRYSDVPEFEVFGFQGTPEKGGAASPDFGGSPGLFTAKSPGGLISQLDTDTPVTSPVRSSPRLRG